MKKLITLASITLSVGFAIALANAEDTSMSKSNTSDSSTTTTGQPGMADSTTTPSHDTSNTMGSDTTTPSTPGDTGVRSSSHMDTKNLKSCTDENGVTTQRGHKGFKECIQNMEKTKKSDQMSGRMGTGSGAVTEHETTTDTTKETTHPSGSDSTY